MNTKLTKYRVMKLSFSLLASIIFSCSDHPPKQDQAIESNSTNFDQVETIELPEISADTNSESRNEVQSDVELVIQTGEVLLDIGKDLVENKRKKDSVFLSKREKMYAYQLGAPLKHEKLAIEAFQKLSDTKGVCVLKKSRKEYLLVKYENKEEEVLDQELATYKIEHSEEVIGEIKKIDLMRECGKRKRPVLSGKIKKRKSEIEIGCLTCDK